MKTNFKILAPISLIFTIIYTICFYKNHEGFTVFLFTLLFVVISMWLFKKYEIVAKKKDLLYRIGLLLLGMLSVITADGRILFLNHLVIILLMVAFYLQRCFSYESWDIPEYLSKFLRIMFGGITKIASPVTDLIKSTKTENETKKARNTIQAILIGFVIAIPILIIMTGLLSQADAVFGYAVNRIIKNNTIPETMI